MGISAGALSVYFLTTEPWRSNWAWGVPLIILTVVFHVWGLGLANLMAVEVFSRRSNSRHHTALFAAVISTVVLIATLLHAAEAMAWAGCYLFLGARPDFKSAMLYSLGAMTTYGSGLLLEEHWRLMGAIEALSGWLLFGMTTAFLFWTIQKCYQVAPRYKRLQSDAGKEH